MSSNQSSRKGYVPIAQDAVLAYRGVLAERQAEILMSWTEHLLQGKEWSLTPHKRAMRCVIELLQNVSKHAGQGGYECGFEKDGRFRIKSYNLVEDGKKQEIEAALVEANSPDIQALKEHRLEKLVDGDRTKGGGAGLGFMDLRVCSDDQVRAEFIPCDIEQFSFVLTVWIHP